MRRAWRRFRAMADAERARVLAIISASAIVGLLYGLGGLSLYLRANFLQPTPAPTPGSVLDLTELPPSDHVEVEVPTSYPTLTPAAPPSGQTGEAAPTLYPTLTPRPGT